MDTTGWRVLVTGAGSGIGLRTAELIVEGGGRVAALDVHGAALTAAAALGDRVTTHVADVRSRPAVDAAIRAAVDEMGTLDRVVNAAGVFRFTPFLSITPEAWVRTIEVNLTGAFHVCQAAIPRLIESGGGRIVNVASIAGVRGGANAADYIASKWGLVGLTKALAVELGPLGIVVNAVAPASIPATGIGRSSLAQKVEMGWGRDEAEAIAAQERDYPLRRLGTADDVARGIRYLLSADAAWMTGQVLSMDGGATAG
jgi:2-hydroxycyclohexanecarboxyl-CoA dehydrogenase